jgi:hypothetical protein
VESRLSTSGQARLPAAERRQAIVDAALRVFAAAATAARRRPRSPARPGLRADPLSPLRSKRELYLACLDAAWAVAARAFDAKLEELGDETR